MKNLVKLLILFAVYRSSGVPLDVYVLADDQGANPAAERSAFEVMLGQVNSVFSQVAMSFELRSYSIVSNTEWITVRDRSTFLDMLDSCPSTNGIPVYVVVDINGPENGLTLPEEGVCIEFQKGYVVLAHELGHMCGLEDVYATEFNIGDAGQPVKLSVRDEMARTEWQPHDWGRYPVETTQGDLIARLLMNGHTTNSAVDITAGDVYGVRIESSTATQDGSVKTQYSVGMAKIGFLRHANRNPSRRAPGKQ